MGNQIIRQPDGHLAIFCSSTDTIIIWDATAEEIVEWFAEQAAERAREDARRHVENVATGDARNSYYQFTKTWEQALTMDREHGGEVWQHFPTAESG
ncbi:hypothetical protein Sme01_03240 [Sphaerisporangium melleum]|uniref:Uncharacterized protein n=1 Tax=Sphaerisporangium melleum TaxID=321316 RepID=A0A917QP83_9ACTN|nr:hypothetical protein [Sphaerisporangium melleum]GGK61501.1 hypothetical protein GCM10007964_00780 [Sphaerisporangium melleum]GII67848.1 hypothetical protein Sme01_03240 [Sphaerisporangium melleum]